MGWGEIVRRIDPSAYHPDCQRARDAVQAMRFENHPLRALVSFERNDAAGEVYVGLEHIAANTGELLSVGQAEEMASGLGFAIGDVLFPKLRPYLNKVWLADRPGLCSTEFHVLRTHPDVTPAFLSVFLRSSFIVRQTSRLMTGTTLPRLQSDDIRALVIPVPDRATQNQVAEFWHEAERRKLERETQAAALLASIDDYLLSELGIVLPPETENTLENRTFRVSAHELGGWRFDPPVHQSVFSLQSDIIESVPLGQVCHVNPRTSFSGLHKDDLAGFVPMDAISDRLGIVKYLSDRRIEECVGYTIFRDQDVLWAKITPCMENGKSAVADGLTNGVGFGSTEFHVIRPRGGTVMSEYIHALLRMGRVRREAKRFFTGSSGHRRVDDAFLRKLVIPVPSVDVQTRLVEEIRNKREQAIELEAQATAELEAAKRKIEAILLGGAA